MPNFFFYCLLLSCLFSALFSVQKLAT
uniref:Uncharacterized protein n=1 Tax=Anguilla anguilla TaxID=7936 RepID=A0A0E9RVT5_ANGAN